MLWLYGLVDRVPAALPAPALGGSGVEVVAGRGRLAAVAERLPVAPPASPRTLRLHDRAVRDLAELVPALLPARFGQTAPDEQELSRLIGLRAASFTSALERVRGCVQVSTRIASVSAEPPGGPRAAALPAAVPDELAGGIGRRYLRDRLRRREADGLDGLCRHLAPFVRETRRRSGPSPLLASAYHLVPRESLAQLVAAAAAFVPPAGTSLAVSPPAPPWAFVEPW